MDENIQPITRDQVPGMLTVLADHIESAPQSREAIATGFRLVALALSPCEDCNASSDPLPVLNGGEAA